MTTFKYHLVTVRFGMWIFLSMEILFFSALFLLFFSERHFYPEAWRLGSQHLEKSLAAINTAVLLTSSFTMATAIHNAEAQAKKTALAYLALTAFLGMTFLGLKFIEYQTDYREGLLPIFNFAPHFAAPKEMFLFFSLYFLGTLIHAAHLLIGILWATVTAIGYASTDKPRSWLARFEALGLYWHFVDIVWIFLFPFFYLTGGRS